MTTGNDDELQRFKEELMRQKKRVDEKIVPIERLYNEGIITKMELVEKLTDVFHELEKE